MVGIATQSAYNSAKFAVRGFTESLQAEYRGTSLTVTCVHPGGIATNIALRARTDGEASEASAEERDESFKQVARTTPTKAAQVIMKGTLAGRRRVFIGWDAWFMHTSPSSCPLLTTQLLLGWDQKTMTLAEAAQTAEPTKLSRSSFFILIAGLLANAVGQAFILPFCRPWGGKLR